MSDTIRFEPSLFKFLRDLKKNNERPWRAERYAAAALRRAAVRHHLSVLEIGFLPKRKPARDELRGPVGVCTLLCPVAPRRRNIIRRDGFFRGARAIPAPRY